MKEICLSLSGCDERQITPDMVGLFFEDINFAADGGLYAEMLENRSFEAVLSKGFTRNYVLREDPLYAWSTLPGEGIMEISPAIHGRKTTMRIPTTELQNQETSI